MQLLILTIFLGLILGICFAQMADSVHEDDDFRFFTHGILLFFGGAVFMLVHIASWF